MLPEQPSGNHGQRSHPLRHTPYSSGTSYPLGLAVSPDDKTAYVVLDNNDTLTKIDLTTNSADAGFGDPRRQRPAQRRDLAGWQTAYVSNEAGRIATQNDFQEYSNGTPVVAEISDRHHGHRHHFRGRPGLLHGHRQHPYRPAPDRHGFWGKYLLVANAYNDSISVIDTTNNTRGAEDRPWAADRRARRHWPVARPTAPGTELDRRRCRNNIAYVALYNANAIAVVDL